MIVIKTSEREFEYTGNIAINFSDNLLYIQGHFHYKPNEDELFIWERKVFDAFFLEDIISIEGY
jgi:hypothetical protein